MEGERTMKNTRRIIALVLILMLTVAGLAVCSAEENEFAGKRIAFISPANQFDFFVYIGARVKQLGEQYGVEIDCFDAAIDVSKLADLMTQTVQQKYDAIIVAPVDTAALIPSVLEANEAGIPVINYDSKVDADCFAHVSSSNYQMGEMAAEWAVEYLTETYGEPKGTIIVLTYPSLETMVQRCEGFEKALAEYENIVIKEEIVPASTAEGGQQLVDNLLIANPVGTVDMIYGSNAGVVLGANAAVEAAAREDVILVGIDNEEGELEAIKAGGSFRATIAQDSVAIGEYAFMAALEAIKGNNSGEVVVPGVLVTSANIDAYIEADAAQKAELESYK